MDAKIVDWGHMPFGIRAVGHPVGATGVSMHVVAARQPAGSTGQMRRADAKLGCVFNMGGSGGANDGSILEAGR